CVLWDNNADNDYSSSENFGFINRSTNELYDNAKSVVSTLINYAKKNPSTDTSNTGNTGSTDNTGDNSSSEKDYSWKD
ncbi:glycoside hydrolase family 5 protein, partial [Enterococcus faecium]